MNADTLFCHSIPSDPPPTSTKAKSQLHFEVTRKVEIGIFDILRKGDKSKNCSIPAVSSGDIV